MGPIQTFRQYFCFCSESHKEEDQGKPIKRTAELNDFKFPEINIEENKKEIEVKNE